MKVSIRTACEVHDHNHGEEVKLLHLEGDFETKCPKHSGPLALVVSVDLFPFYTCEGLSSQEMDELGKSIVRILAETNVLDRFSTEIQEEMERRSRTVAVTS